MIPYCDVKKIVGYYNTEFDQYCPTVCVCGINRSFVYINVKDRRMDRAAGLWLVLQKCYEDDGDGYADGCDIRGSDSTLCWLYCEMRSEGPTVRRYERWQTFKFMSHTSLSATGVFFVLSFGDSWEREFSGAGCERGHGLRQWITQHGHPKKTQRMGGWACRQGRSLSDWVAWESHPQVQVKREKLCGGRERGQMVPQNRVGGWWDWTGRANYRVVGAKMECYHWSYPNPKSYGPAPCSLHPSPLHFWHRRGSHCLNGSVAFSSIVRLFLGWWRGVGGANRAINQTGESQVQVQLRWIAWSSPSSASLRPLLRCCPQLSHVNTPQPTEQMKLSSGRSQTQACPLPAYFLRMTYCPNILAQWT